MLLRSDEGWESFAFKDSLKLDVPKWSFNVFITHVPADPLPARPPLPSACDSLLGFAALAVSGSLSLRRRPQAVATRTVANTARQTCGALSGLREPSRSRGRSALSTARADGRAYWSTHDCAGGRTSVLEYSRLRGWTEEGTRVPTAARMDGGGYSSTHGCAGGRRSTNEDPLRSEGPSAQRPMLQRAADVATNAPHFGVAQ